MLSTSSSSSHAAPIPTLKLSSLSPAQKEHLLHHLASSPLFHADTVRHSYDGRIVCEVMLPTTLCDTLQLTRRDNVLASSAAGGAAGGGLLVGGSFGGPSAAAAAGFPLFVTPLGFGRSTTSPTEREEPLTTPRAAPHAQKKQATTPPVTLPENKRPCSWIHRLIDEIFAFRAKRLHYELVQQDYERHIMESYGEEYAMSCAAVNDTLRRDGKVLDPGSAMSSTNVDDLSLTVYRYFSSSYGVPSMIKKAAGELLAALRVYRTVDLHVQLFGVLLSSQCYDALDVRRFLQWRETLLPYSMRKQEPVGKGLRGVVTRLFVRVRDIPALLRKCIQAGRAEQAVESGSTVKVDKDVWTRETALWHRCRAALPQWCNPQRAFPGTVADPNFYCPPFRAGHPYIGTVPTLQHSPQSWASYALVLEGRFAADPDHLVVHIEQLLALLLLNWKVERQQPLEPMFNANVAAASATLHRVMSTTRPSLAHQSSSSSSPPRPAATGSGATTPSKRPSVAAKLIRTGPLSSVVRHVPVPVYQASSASPPMPVRGSALFSPRTANSATHSPLTASSDGPPQIPAIYQQLPPASAGPASAGRPQRNSSVVFHMDPSTVISPTSSAIFQRSPDQEDDSVFPLDTQAMSGTWQRALELEHPSSPSGSPPGSVGASLRDHIQSCQNDVQTLEHALHRRASHPAAR